MKLPIEAHAIQPWRIHEITADFRVEDVWALPTPGGPDDFARLMGLSDKLNPESDSPAVVRGLWALRWKLGELFGWDEPDDGLGERVGSLRDRLPQDLRDAPDGPRSPTLPFEPLYLLDHEFAGEIANRTMHSVLHLGWVPDGEGGWRGQMAVLDKRNGLFGDLYMAAIKPFRHLLVYPAMLRSLERTWPTPARTG
jgi:hypothetical protein